MAISNIELTLLGENSDLINRNVMVRITILISLGISLLLTSCNSSSDDSAEHFVYSFLVEESRDIQLKKDLKNNRFKLTNRYSDIEYANLKFVRRISSYFQVLDSDNDVFYIGEDWIRREYVHDISSVCGTVPHYSLTVRQKADFFEVLEDETRDDSGNKIPAEIKFKIDRSETDLILFVNGKDKFDFTLNDAMYRYTDLCTVILKKDGEYFTNKNRDLKLDVINFSNSHVVHQTKKDNLYGLLGLVEPEYKRIEKFEYFLAKAETQDGKSVFIDFEGKEYHGSSFF